MASTNVLFLRPPPNVEFVQGFPGIPPHAPDRPPSYVKGVVELRPTGNSIKARWLRIELRKVETLPGGGQSNTYIDLIGEPVTLWQAPGEWEELRARDFVFEIRIPEAVPPSIALERNAGIKYELVASVLTKGKKGLLRRESTAAITATSPILIDKHELHSAWPIYAQPESRSRVLDGYTLTVNRTHTAYGPGDRIAVQTFVKNNTDRTNQVRFYEFALREHVVYRLGPQGGNRRTVPPARTSNIQEQRIPITIASPLHPGMQAKAELSLGVPMTHTTTTVSWAQRIEVSYAIHVKAVLAGGQQLFLDLPITMSNWTRAQSSEMVRRIGHADNLSLGPSFATSPPLPSQTPDYPQQPQGPGGWSPPASNFSPGRGPSPGIGMNPNHGVNPNPGFVGAWSQPQVPNTMGGPQVPSGAVGEFGLLPAGVAQRHTMGGMPQVANPAFDPNGGLPSSTPTSPPWGVDSQQAQPARRQGVGTANPTHRFTVVNPAADESSPISPFNRGPSSMAGKTYASAQDEKRQLEEAMSRVDRHGTLQQTTPSYSGTFDQNAQSSTSRSSPPIGPSSPEAPKKWMTAQEEKAQLMDQRQRFEAAREKALQMQTMGRMQADQATGSDNASQPEAGMSGGTNARNGLSQSAPWPSAAEEKERLYQEAQAKADRFQGANPQVWSQNRQSSMDAGGAQNAMSPGKALYQSALASIRNPVGPSGNQPMSPGSLNPAGQYPSAADEKEALRFQRAQEAAKIKQGAGPIPYDALFPAATADLAPIQPLNVTRSRSPPAEPEAPEQYNNLPSAPGYSDQRPIMNAKDEKERMRQLYEAQDNAARQVGGTSMAGGSFIPPLQPAGHSSAPGRSTSGLPLPPAAGRQLSAADEKARLKAQYEDEDATPQSRGSSASRPFSSEDRPPVPPRPQTVYDNLQPNGFGINGSSGASSSVYFDTPMKNGLEQSRMGDRTPDYYHEESSDVEPASWARPFGKQTTNAVPPPPPPLPNKPPVEYYRPVNGSSSVSTAEPRIPDDQERPASLQLMDIRPLSPFSFDYSDSPSMTFSRPPPPPLPPKPII